MPEQSHQSEVENFQEDPLYSSLRTMRDSIEELDRKIGSPVMSADTRAKLEDARGKLAKEYDSIRASLLEDEDQEGTEPDELRQQKLQEAITALTSDTVDDELLQKLGMLDEEGKFVYPENLFTHSSDQKWEDYLKAVAAHMDEVDRAKDTHETDNVRLKALDVKRVQKHDEFTRSLMKDLGLEDNEENFAAVRRLAAKMRDSIVPRSGEAELTARYVRQLIQNQINDIEQRQAS